MRRAFPVTILLILVHLAAFIVQEINATYGVKAREDFLALSTWGLKSGYLWQLLTFQFLHDGFFHFAFNMLMLFMFGRPVEEFLGPKRFLTVYFLCGVFGGIVQASLAFLFPQIFGRPVVGASAGVLGLIAAFAFIDPEREILFMLVVPMRAKFLFVVSIAIASFYILVPSPGSRGSAHGAHFGGLLMGAFYIKYLLQYEFSWGFLHRLKPRRRPREMRTRFSKPTPGRSKTDPEPLPPEEFISREVDPILDKISAHGLQSLTPRERQILEAARSKMERR